MHQPAEIPIFDKALAPIRVLNVGRRLSVATARKFGPKAHDFLGRVTSAPAAALRIADKIARRWLAERNSPYLAELDELAALSRRPGVYYMNINYEWGCTTAAKVSDHGKSAVLQRALDWNVSGLGEYLVAARVYSRRGTWIALTWPGFSGVVQATAPGRFAAAINQPPRRRVTGIGPIDRAIALRAVWKSRDEQPVHLLRRVFDEAPDFVAAVKLLTETPICCPAIFTIAGTLPDERLVIERQENASVIIAGPACATNHWQRNEGHSQSYPAFKSEDRLKQISESFGEAFTWLSWPILNDETRLAMVADPASGRLLAQGYESYGPATAILDRTF